MTGKSYPENTFDFYEPVMSWLEEYFHKSGCKDHRQYGNHLFQFKLFEAVF